VGGGWGEGPGHGTRFYRCKPCKLRVVTGVPRLDVLKALGDNTRYAIYLELARSAAPLSTSDVAESLGLHPNTVRPHLERMREVGLLDVRTEVRSGVGRPQHLYTLAEAAPSLGLEPPTFPRLAQLLVRLAARAGAGGDDAADVGREQGLADARHHLDAPSLLEALVAVVAFAHCPYRNLAETNTTLVCNLHRGMVEGFVAGVGGAEVGEFCDLAHRTPCQVTVSHRIPA
jgi:predicted ArsR family transcriptional regulator